MGSAVGEPGVGLAEADGGTGEAVPPGRRPGTSRAVKDGTASAAISPTTTTPTTLSSATSQPRPADGGGSYRPSESARGGAATQCGGGPCGAPPGGGNPSRPAYGGVQGAPGGAWWAYLKQNYGIRYELASAGSLRLNADPGLGVRNAERKP